MAHHHNTILITGGGSGIGRALAEAFHAEGHHVIIAGRRAALLDQVTAANPGMRSTVLDISDAAAIRAFGPRIANAFPHLDTVIHNAGIMRPEQLLQAHLDDAEATVATNLLGPIRLTAALLPHLLAQTRATIMTVSSGLAFLPLTATPTYCATKAAIHSYTQSLRHQLRDSTVRVLELIPPYVQTGLMGAHQASDPHAMPLAAFIAETMSILRQHPEREEICVERVLPLRHAAVDGNYATIFASLNQTSAG